MAAETAEVHEALSDGQRAHDLMIATENVAGELLDLAAHERSPSDVDPLQASEDLERAYAGLWALDLDLGAGAGGRDEGAAVDLGTEG